MAGRGWIPPGRVLAFCVLVETGLAATRWTGEAKCLRCECRVSGLRYVDKHTSSYCVSKARARARTERIGRGVSGRVLNVSFLVCVSVRVLKDPRRRVLMITS